MTNKNNIVLIMTDTQGTNILGCYGRPEMKTPCIDKLADEGIKFERAYSCQPVCGPARAALFTGLYPHTNGVIGNNIDLGMSVKTIGQRLTDNGYHSAYIGKWHLDGSDYFGTGQCPEGWDPDYWYDGRNYMDDLSDEERIRWRTELDTPEAMHKNNITEEFTWAHKNSNKAIDFLEKRNEEKPCFLVVSYDEPHGPSTCPSSYCDMFKDFEYKTEKNTRDDLKNKPQHQKDWANFLNLPENNGTLKDPMYFGCNSFVDYEIGRVIEAVEKHMPDAMIIFTSDHGSALHAHRLQDKGPAMYDEIARIPLLIKWKDHIVQGSVSENPATHIDIVPTILDAAGLESPDILHGKSMLAELSDPSHKTNDCVFMEWTRYEVDHDSFGGLQPIRTVFNGQYKLSVNLHFTDELYDLKNDPQEMINLIDDEKYIQIRNELHDRILNWMDETRDPYRGYVWANRSWRTDIKKGWTGNGKTRLRPDDGYYPRLIHYREGIPAKDYLTDCHEKK
jgi:uncharacterized sulfatase